MLSKMPNYYFDFLTQQFTTENRQKKLQPFMKHFKVLYNDKLADHISEDSLVSMASILSISLQSLVKPVQAQQT